ncbi:hypothetical protein PENFLA_c039G09344 [Penicillium flavigenum]|uniref:Apple domain-containing protein n=1 Tax=Penicillium flavigenum TaxID=254877 RepID=A0A1V6SK12_9EURO|nr:hypothetical protein PENFLA_c039G09344 [Penicillium flavigenum]
MVVWSTAILLLLGAGGTHATANAGDFDKYCPNKIGNKAEFNSLSYHYQCERFPNPSMYRRDLRSLDQCAATCSKESSCTAMAWSTRKLRCYFTEGYDFELVNFGKSGQGDWILFSKAEDADTSGPGLSGGNCQQEVEGATEACQQEAEGKCTSEKDTLEQELEERCKTQSAADNQECQDARADCEKAKAVLQQQLALPKDCTAELDNARLKQQTLATKLEEATKDAAICHSKAKNTENELKEWQTKSKAEADKCKATIDSLKTQLQIRPTDPWHVSAEISQEIMRTPISQICV